MKLTTDALIIRENNTLGESDRFVTALTRELGVIRASVRGARQLKNRNGSATQLLCYSRLSLYKGREKYIVDDAEPLQVFFDVRGDLTKLALAQYFCELAGVLAPAEEEAEEEPVIDEIPDDLYQAYVLGFLLFFTIVIVFYFGYRFIAMFF